MATVKQSLLIQNVHLALENWKDARLDLFSVKSTDGVIEKISPMPGDSGPHKNENTNCMLIDGKGGILIPSLCHSHIHLDKCNILSQCDDLVSGTFQEAMTVTAKAKALFHPDDLVSRGRRLILESVKYGVTAMRAHVEVDTTVHFRCLEAGFHLKKELKDLCDIGITVFAQDPLFLSPSHMEASENLALVREAAAKPGISAVGSAPYVEPSFAHSLQNIDHILEIAISCNLHVDFHLDYNLSPTSEPLIHYVTKKLRALEWTRRLPEKRVTIGHATRLSLFSEAELRELREDVKDLPITFIGLPQSDMYMMGREDPHRPRGTLRVPQLVREHGLDAAISVNNVGNAFTPQGSLDPLSLCTFGVAVYQAGTPADCHILLEAVSNTSRRAAGFSYGDNLKISEGDPADLLLVHGNDSVQSLVLNPGFERTVIKGGRVVAWKTATVFTASVV